MKHLGKGKGGEFYTPNSIPILGIIDLGVEVIECFKCLKQNCT